MFIIQEYVKVNRLHNQGIAFRVKSRTDRFGDQFIPPAYGPYDSLEEVEKILTDAGFKKYEDHPRIWRGCNDYGFEIRPIEKLKFKSKSW